MNPLTDKDFMFWAFGSKNKQEIRKGFEYYLKNHCHLYKPHDNENIICVLEKIYSIYEKQKSQ